MSLTPSHIPSTPRTLEERELAFLEHEASLPDSSPASSSSTVTFAPNTAQERALRAMRPGDRMFWRSGVGTGKTSMVIFTAFRLAHLNPRTPGLVVSHNLNHVEIEIIQPLITMLREAGTYRSRNVRLQTLYLKNGATIQWKGAHKPDSIDGRNVGWGLSDETRYWPKESFTKFVSRIRVACPFPFEGYFTTPEMNWIAAQFKDNPDFKEIVAKTSENAKNLQPGFYERLQRSLSDDVYESYVNGEWMHISGGVFPEYKEDVHACDPDLYDASQPVHVAFDPAAHRSAAIFFQHLRWCRRHETEHCIHVLDELMLTDVATVWADPQWKAKYYHHAWDQGIVYIDAAGKSRDQATHMTNVTVLRDLGWQCKYTTDPFKRSIVTGIQAIKGKLKPVLGRPSLYFHPRLHDDPSERGIIRSVAESKYPDARGTDRDDQPTKDGILDHARDTLRYAIVNLCPLPAVSMIRPAT